MMSVDPQEWVRSWENLWEVQLLWRTALAMQTTQQSWESVSLDVSMQLQVFKQQQQQIH